MELNAEWTAQTELRSGRCGPIADALLNR
jgi:hypothetical protein